MDVGVLQNGTRTKARSEPCDAIRIDAPLGCVDLQSLKPVQ
jgi:hypothetical protein